MENELSNEYIENAINELNDCFGIKEPISGRYIFSLIKKRKIKEGIKLIAHYMDLPIDINVTISVQFQSSHLVRIAKNEVQGREGIIAQVNIPKDLPIFGSSALENYPINVKISKNYRKYPALFSMIMAHELSHVLLYSLMHPQKENEFYTDLLAIMLGFQKIFPKGRKRRNIITTATYGYLTDEQFNFALKKINLILEKNRKRKKVLLKKLKKFNKLLLKYEKSVFKFKKFLEYLTKNPNPKISGEDGKRIVIFFQPGYMDEIDLSIKDYKRKQKLVEDFLKNLFHYKKQVINQLLTYDTNLEIYIKEFKNKVLSIEKDVKMLKKYVGYNIR